MTNADEPATVVLVHGAWHGAWCWDNVVELLTDAGVRSVAVELPFTDLAADVAATTAAIDAVEGPAVLVGHSYGGIVISEAGNHPAVRHLVYVCAFAADSGRSAASAVDEHTAPTELGKGFIIGDDGQVTLDREIARACFYADCDPADADAALDRLRPISFACFNDTVTTAAWRTKPSTYALCTEDRAVHPELQRVLAAGCTNIVEWPTSHSPFLSQPALVADLLVSLTA